MRDLTPFRTLHLTTSVTPICPQSSWHTSTSLYSGANESRWQYDQRRLFTLENDPIESLQLAQSILWKKKTKGPEPSYRLPNLNDDPAKALEDVKSYNSSTQRLYRHHQFHAFGYTKPSCSSGNKKVVRREVSVGYLCACEIHGLGGVWIPPPAMAGHWWDFLIINDKNKFVDPVNKQSLFCDSSRTNKETPSLRISLNRNDLKTRLSPSNQDFGSHNIDVHAQTIKTIK